MDNKKEIKEPTLLRSGIEIVGLSIMTLIVVFLMNKYIFTTYQVSGESMSPTFKDGEKVYLSKISKPLHLIDRGDVLIFHATEDRDYIKRLIGLPGDKVEYTDDTLYINGKSVNEEYLKYNKEHKQGNQLTPDFNLANLPNTDGKLVIPKGKYLVLGDNRQNSVDSRMIGLVDEDEVVGQVFTRIYPLDKFKIGFEGKDFDKLKK